MASVPEEEMEDEANEWGMDDDFEVSLLRGENDPETRELWDEILWLKKHGVYVEVAGFYWEDVEGQATSLRPVGVSARRVKAWAMIPDICVASAIRLGYNSVVNQHDVATGHPHPWRWIDLHYTAGAGELEANAAGGGGADHAQQMEG